MILQSLHFILLITIIIVVSTFLIYDYIADAPFIPVRKRASEQIVRALKLKQGSVIYDLGCGDARVLIEAVKQTKNLPRRQVGIKVVGVEKNIVVYLLAKWRTRNTPIEIRLGDINSVFLKDATHIYLYLFPEMMNKILPKIKTECVKGTRIVSCDFMFEELSPDEIIEINATTSMCKKLYVYVLK